MASRRGMTLRNEAAQGRIDLSLAVLAADRDDLPSVPLRSRDPFLNETLRLEWTADVLEVLAGTGAGDAPGIVETTLDREALKGRKLDELKALALDAGADPDAVGKARSKDAVLDLLEARIEADSGEDGDQDDDSDTSEGEGQEAESDDVSDQDPPDDEADES